jgi:anti-sigma B factor antagonist
MSIRISSLENRPQPNILTRKNARKSLQDMYFHSLSLLLAARRLRRPKLNIGTLRGEVPARCAPRAHLTGFRASPSIGRTGEGLPPCGGFGRALQARSKGRLRASPAVVSGHARSRVRVSVHFKDDISVVSLSGKFVAGSDGPYLRQKVRDLIEAGTRQLLFEFSEVPYIDSTGLGFLVGSREVAAEAGAIIVVSGMNPHVRRILEGVKLAQFFDLVEDEAAGLARLRELAKAQQNIAAGKGAKAADSRRQKPAAGAEK